MSNDTEKATPTAADNKKTAPSGKGSRNGGCKVILCTCKDAEQDSIYKGTGRRLANKCNKGWRCTVCAQVST